jgi:hypothetical protein
MGEPKKLVQVFIDGDGFHSKGWYFQNRSVLIEKGSTISKVAQPSLISGGKVERQIIVGSIIKDLAFQKDYVFNSASSCISAISGSNDGPRNIKVAGGSSLKDYIESHPDALDSSSIEECGVLYLESEEHKHYERDHLELYKKWGSFLKKFSKNFIANMSIDDYVEGTRMTKDSFCYKLEWELRGLGSIRNSTADAKFGVHFDKKLGDYTFQKKRKTKEDAFETIRSWITSLLDAGERNDISSIEQNGLSEMFKSKIYFVYFKENALPIYSVSQIDFFLRTIGINCEIDNVSSFEKRRLLLEYKNDSPVFSKLSNLEFMSFLYSSYGFKKETDLLKKHSQGISVPGQKVEIVRVDSLFDKASRKSPSGLILPKTDFLEANKNKLDYGTMAEEIVLSFERKNNRKYRHKITRLSRDTDSYHYDVLSFDSSGHEKHIEVKAKSGGSLSNIDFYLSSSELATMKSDKSYCIYYVIGIKTSHIQIVPINIELLSKVALVPESYRICATSIAEEDILKEK